MIHCLSLEAFAVEEQRHRTGLTSAHIFLATKKCVLRDSISHTGGARARALLCRLVTTSEARTVEVEHLAPPRDRGAAAGAGGESWCALACQPRYATPRCVASLAALVTLLHVRRARVRACFVATAPVAQ